ncbi:MAG: TonB-dependent receptor, partial [Gammaproteobacteria bacterium]|nr:TonB-dependent receptor [Gammaproteobacteria bacterium]
AHAQNKAGVNEATTAAYNRVDASISRDFTLAGTVYKAILKGRNLADEEIRSSASFIRDYAPEAGRNIELALRVSF